MPRSTSTPAARETTHPDQYAVPPEANPPAGEASPPAACRALGDRPRGRLRGGAGDRAGAGRQPVARVDPDPRPDAEAARGAARRPDGHGHRWALGNGN